MLHAFGKLPVPQPLNYDFVLFIVCLQLSTKTSKNETGREAKVTQKNNSRTTCTHSKTQQGNFYV